jgi:hypothetical protein
MEHPDLVMMDHSVCPFSWRLLLVRVTTMTTMMDDSTNTSTTFCHDDHHNQPNQGNFVATAIRQRI